MRSSNITTYAYPRKRAGFHRMRKACIPIFIKFLKKGNAPHSSTHLHLELSNAYLRHIIHDSIHALNSQSTVKKGINERHIVSNKPSTQPSISSPHPSILSCPVLSTTPVNMATTTTTTTTPIPMIFPSHDSNSQRNTAS